MKLKRWLNFGLGAGLLAFAMAVQAQQQGGTLSLIVQPEPPVLIPAINQQGPTQYVTGKIYESLLKYTHDLEPLPNLAKSWEMAEDGMSVTFHLEEGVKWHDGEPFTADDVVFSMTDMLPKAHGRARVILNRYLDDVEKIDDHTVVMKLKSPFPAFMLMFEPGFAPMMPKHIYEGEDYINSPHNQTPIGTGPFKFKEWRRGEHIKLERNPDYWKEGKPYLDEVIFNVIPDSASRAVAYEQGSVDVLRGGDVDNVDVQRLVNLPNTDMTTKGWEMFSPQAYYLFNMRNEPFDNVKVRQAVMAAIDREVVLKNIMFGQGRLATGPFAYTEMFYDPDTPPIEFDLDRAKELIEESGINPGDYTIRLLSYPYRASWERLDEYTKQALERLGFKVNLVATDAGGWASSTGDWDFDLTTAYAYQYGDPALGVERFYIEENNVKGSPFANVQGYVNPELDEKWAQAAVSNDPEERQRLYSEIQNQLVNDVGQGYLLDLEFPTIYRDNIKNLVQTAIGLNENFDDVYIDE